MTTQHILTSRTTLKRVANYISWRMKREMRNYFYFENTTEKGKVWR